MESSIADLHVDKAKNDDDRDDDDGGDDKTFIKRSFPSQEFKLPMHVSD